MPEASAPVAARPVFVPPARQAAVKSLSIDDFADHALENQAKEPPKPGRKPPKGIDVDQVVDDVMDSLGEPEESEEEPAEPDDEPTELDDEPDPEDDEAPDLRGTREQPYKRGDIPTDKFIELKIDGEKKVVKLSEALDGYVAQKTFHQRAQRLHEQTTQVESIVADARAMKQGVQQEIRDLFNNPTEFYELLRDRYEGTLDQVARMYAKQDKEWRENPRSRLEHEHRIAQRQIENERTRLAAEREASQRSTQEQRAVEQNVKIIQPGWEEGMRLTGYPENTPELREMVNAQLMERLRATGQPFTAKDVATAVQRAVRALDLKPGTGKKPKPAQVFAGARRGPAAASPEARRGGKREVDLGKPGRRTEDFFLPARMR